MSKSISNKSILGALTVNAKNVPVISYSDTTPTSPAVGDLWFNTTTGYTYLYYNDGTSSQWVGISTSGAGAQGVVSATSPLSYNSSTQSLSLSTIGVATGGTGNTSLTSGSYLKGNGTSAIVSQAGIPAGDITSGSLDVARGGTGVSTGAGLINVVPTATYVGSGSASVASNGMITFSGTNYITFAGAFSSTYDRYQVQISGYSGPGTYLGMRGATNGSGNSAAAYYDGGMYRQGGGTGIWTNQSGTTQMQVGYVPGNEWWQATVEVINPNNGNACTFMNRAFYMGGSGTTVLTDGKFNGTSAFDGLQFWCTGGGTFAGQIRVLAYRK